jgi:hypothetical protein
MNWEDLLQAVAASVRQVFVTSPLTWSTVQGRPVSVLRNASMDAELLVIGS